MMQNIVSELTFSLERLPWSHETLPGGEKPPRGDSSIAAWRKKVETVQQGMAPIGILRFISQIVEES